MKKLFKIVSINLLVICCLIASGCSCGSPMTISYSVEAPQVPMTVEVTLTKKFREPASTPCYKKVEAGFTKLESSAEIEECYSGKIKCYRKESRKNYVEITERIDLMACERDKNCYEKSDVDYFKLLTNPEGISACYDAEGNAFERATFEKAEKLEIESIYAVSVDTGRYSYSSSENKIPSNKNYSLIYEFEITNRENNSIYIEAQDFEKMFDGVIKDTSAYKVKFTINTSERVFENNKFYYKISGNSSITLKIEMKDLKTSDMTKRSNKKLNINLLIIAK